MVGYLAGRAGRYCDWCAYVSFAREYRAGVAICYCRLGAADGHLRDLRRDSFTEGDRRRVDVGASRRGIGAVRHPADYSARIWRACADLADWRLCADLWCAANHFGLSHAQAQRYPQSYNLAHGMIRTVRQLMANKKRR